MKYKIAQSSAKWNPFLNQTSNNNNGKNNQLSTKITQQAKGRDPYFPIFEKGQLFYFLFYRDFCVKPMVHSILSPRGLGTIEKHVIYY